MNSIDRERFSVGALPIWVHHEHQARWRFATQHVAGKTVVDCACGVGLGTAIFAEAGAARVFAFDLSDDAVAQAQAQCADLPTVTVQQADGCALPLPDDSIDVFISFESIEHIDDDRGFLREVVRVLRPDGKFLCSTPNRTITMPGKQLETTPWNPFHVREYNQSEFRAMLEAHFASVDMYGQNPTPSWRVGMLNGIGRLFPGHVGGRVNSALKLPRLAYDKEVHHVVTQARDTYICEYLVALCGQPR